MPKELKIDIQGRVVVEDGNLVYVDGVEAFEQRLVRWVQHYHRSVIGLAESQENTIKELRLQSQRVVDSYDLIDEMTRFSYVRTSPTTYELNIEYTTDTNVHQLSEDVSI